MGRQKVLAGRRLQAGLSRIGISHNMSKQIGIRIFPNLVSLRILRRPGKDFPAASPDFPADYLFRKGVQSCIIRAVDGTAAFHDHEIRKIPDHRQKHQRKAYTGDPDFPVYLFSTFFDLPDFFFFPFLGFQRLPDLLHIFFCILLVCAAPVFFPVQCDPPRPVLRCRVPV